MKIKQWKQFSDAVDKHNKKFSAELSKKEGELRATSSLEDFGIRLGALYVQYKHRFIDKNEINFYEWQAGKLKLK